MGLSLAEHHVHHRVMPSEPVAPLLTTFPLEMAHWMDQTIDPCDDFYEYACGGWFNETALPPAALTVSTRWTAYANVTATIATILNSSDTNLGRFYQSCMDNSTRNALGIEPLQTYLHAIRTAPSKATLLTIAAQLSMMGMPSFAHARIEQDNTNATQAILVLSPNARILGGVKTNTSEAFEAIHGKYIWTLLTLAGHSTDEANDSHDHIVAANERFLACDGKDDITELSAGDASALYPHAVAPLLDILGFATKPLNVTLVNQDTIRHVDAMLGNMTIETLQAVVAFRLLDHYATYLTDDFSTAKIEYVQAIANATTTPTRQALCTQAVKDLLPDVLSASFVDKVWTPAAQASAVAIVDAIKRTFRDSLPQAEWMDDETRALAVAKLDNMLMLMGGQEQPITHVSDDVSLDPTAYIQNRILLSLAINATKVLAVDKPYNRKRWDVFQPFEYNCMFYQGQNKILFAPAYMQSPDFFSDNDSVARNFGAFGMVAGHEMGHGFDNKGKYFDRDGTQRLWWTNTTLGRFKARAQCFIDQMTAMDVVSDVTGHVLGKINGTTTLGETIADNTGVQMAFRAYKASVQRTPSKYTNEMGDKMFFVSFAQANCEKNADVYWAKIVSKNPHPPGRHRVTGVVQNSHEFARAFNCPVNAPMNPANKCSVWR
ncbi:Aste57867_10411 [Aphanomyces stellatus]|uniref:Aste57867_10411 protein n=1 Tax=Aphanomyces stellatus TaxID=120398 RepID=A0A485KQS9_9STRA|nr:hypothetical protein As57867_010371 [Aphanomyces stellatus]VFT87285.1 Aste57867_10411 [Aphanomyces stellatus]